MDVELRCPHCGSKEIVQIFIHRNGVTVETNRFFCYECYRESVID